jgi:hypothetical protein
MTGASAPAAAAEAGEGGLTVRDPHIHVEKTIFPGFGHAAMSMLITRATGLAGDLPRTVTTGCGRRRGFAMTSTVPERVTCLACRDYAAAEYAKQAEMAEALLSVPPDDPLWGTARVTPAGLAAQAREDRAMAARYASS